MSERFFPLSSGKAAWESSIAQTWAVTEKKTASGKRRAISSQLYPSYTFSVDFTLNDAEISQLAGFYARCKGGLLPFWYKDFGAHAEMQELACDAGGAYQCVSITGGYVEACRKVDNLRVYVDGTETLDYSESGGLITLSAGTEVHRSVCASYDYYRYVKFAGELSVKQLAPDINSVSLKLESVR
ncbi:DUF2460 domain-containing protein [Phascolarctobacterium succinatutens]|uniref:DUF2460 domain-containing protein n=1 Tax=Phascolarctobacterium succinatutens TaxID=626940 RepID=UPI0026ED7372|nr:DUF2460 domain-containing protein [Phascolarctobacterium succinatutens]